MRKLAQRIVSRVDGRERPSAHEEELNRIVHAALATPAGEDLMLYLEELTVKRVMTPDGSTNELWFREGARWLTGVLKARMIEFRKQEKKAHE